MRRKRRQPLRCPKGCGEVYFSNDYRLRRGELLDYDKAQQPALKRKNNDRAQYGAWVAAKAAYVAAPRRSDRSGLKEAVKRAHAGLEVAGLAKRLCVRGAEPLPWWRMEAQGLFSIYEQLGKCAGPPPSCSSNSHPATLSRPHPPPHPPTSGLAVQSCTTRGSAAA